MSSSHATPKYSALTRWCSGLIQMLSYEDILSMTVYLPPMLFMVGPASIVANNPLITLVLNAIVGFAFSWVLHRVGHRLLKGLPNEPKVIYLSTSLRLPGELTLTQFVWMMEVTVAVAVFSGSWESTSFLSAVFLRFCLAQSSLPWVSAYIFSRSIWGGSGSRDTILHCL